MKHRPKNDHSLESYRIFPYLAWGAVLFMSFMVWNLAQELNELSEGLENRWSQPQPVFIIEKPQTPETPKTIE